uniref:Zinc finger protein 821 n=1 Tax=Paramormyrops kingsleyae TaxID=1676925 RepID=A0A3B3S7F6_9TELE|nr:zinc finger protein 821 isoform X1 [Paramormyrops kingsleyae]XP_023646480.1 zinc finger protein 821 isoform X1 [Paramormyrops kingsleyae]
MSRRKQTNPFKVNWSFPIAGLSGPEHTMNTEGREDFAEDSECHSNNSQDPGEQDSVTDDSDSDPDNPGEDSSSNTSADDSMTGGKTGHCSLQGGEVKEEREEGSELGNSYLCPLCTLEFGSPEQLIAHVYQHTATVGSSKSYVCPVCGRALSSPGSLGRHLLIHSEDRLSNCAVCGARFTNTNNFNREKLKEFLNAGSGESSSGDEACGLSQVFSSAPMADGGPGATLPSLSDSLLSPGPALPSLPDGLSPPGAGLPPLADILGPTPVYPAGVLLVCNTCVAYQQLVESQSPSTRKWAVRRKNEPQEARVQRLERERTAKKSKRARETAEEREMRRLRDREAKRLQRMQETEEQRARRLQRDREAMRLKRANETPEKRQARLVREREAKRLKRRLEKIDPSLRTQIEHDPAAMAALTADMSLFQFPCPMPCPPLDAGLLMKLP